LVHPVKGRIVGDTGSWPWKGAGGRPDAQEAPFGCQLQLEGWLGEPHALHEQPAQS
jgi:hypothetical protein